MLGIYKGLLLAILTL